MERRATRIRDGTVYVEAEESWIEVGPLTSIYEVLGGETVICEYEDEARAFDWLDLDSDATMTINVREALDRMTFMPAFVERLASRSLATDAGEIPERTRYFAELMEEVWRSKGNLKATEGDNPFTGD